MTDGEKHGRLADLIAATWTEAEIRGQARRMGPKITGSLPGQGVALTQLADEFADLLRRRGKADTAFFKALGEHVQPDLLDELRAVAMAWGVSLLSSAQPVSLLRSQSSPPPAPAPSSLTRSLSAPPLPEDRPLMAMQQAVLNAIAGHFLASTNAMPERHLRLKLRPHYTAAKVDGAIAALVDLGLAGTHHGGRSSSYQPTFEGACWSEHRADVKAYTLTLLGTFERMLDHDPSRETYTPADFPDLDAVGLRTLISVAVLAGFSGGGSHSHGPGEPTFEHRFPRFVEELLGLGFGEYLRFRQTPEQVHLRDMNGIPTPTRLPAAPHSLAPGVAASRLDPAPRPKSPHQTEAPSPATAPAEPTSSPRIFIS